jgi:hypothetical protein
VSFRRVVLNLAAPTKYKFLILNYGVCFKTYAFPLRISELANGLEKRGYEINPQIPFPRPPVAFGATGTLARKGKTVIRVDTSEQALTVADISVKSAMETFDEIGKMLEEDYRINLDSLVGVYEFVVQCEIATEKPAIETVAKNVKLPILNQIEGILGSKLWPIGLRFSGANMKFNSANWFDFSIEPSFERNDSYFVVITYRSAKKDESRSFVESFEEKIEKILELINE